MAKQNLVYQFVFVLTGIEVKFLLSGFSRIEPPSLCGKIFELHLFGVESKTKYLMKLW